MLEQSLPQEIVETVIDCLHDDLSTMKSLSIVSRATCHRSQSHIFSSVCLFHPASLGTYSQRTCQLFYDLLTGSPHIARFVRNLRLSEATHSPGSGWIARDVTLPLVLDMLVYLNSLSVEFSVPTERFTWSALSSDLQASLARLSEPHRALHTLKVSCVSRVPCLQKLFQFVNSCSTLKNLDLHRVGNRNSWDDLEWLRAFSDMTWGPQLESLSISDRFGVPGSALSTCGLPINVTRLRNFVCVHGHSTPSFFPHFWNSVADTLENLTIVELWVRSTISPLASLVTPGTGSLRHLRSLRRLTIRFQLARDIRSGSPMIFINNRDEYDISGIYDSLSLETVLVILEIEPMSYSVFTRAHSSLQSLDAAMTRDLPPHSPLLLRQVTVRYKNLHPGRDRVGDDSQLRAFLEDCFPNVLAKGCFKLDDI